MPGVTGVRVRVGMRVGMRHFARRQGKGGKEEKRRREERRGPAGLGGRIRGPLSFRG